MRTVWRAAGSWARTWRGKRPAPREARRHRTTATRKPPDAHASGGLVVCGGQDMTGKTLWLAWASASACASAWGEGADWPCVWTG